MQRRVDGEFERAQIRDETAKAKQNAETRMTHERERVVRNQRDMLLDIPLVTDMVLVQQRR